MPFCFCGQGAASILCISSYIKRRVGSEITLPWNVTQEIFFTRYIPLSIFKNKKEVFGSKCSVQIFLYSADLMSCYLSGLMKLCYYIDGFKFFLDFQLIVWLHWFCTLDGGTTESILPQMWLLLAAFFFFFSVLRLCNTEDEDRMHFSLTKYLSTLFSLCLWYMALNSSELLVTLAVLL